MNCMGRCIMEDTKLKINEEDILVSVICTVYNHEKYLKKCLDGFIMQKTDFRFEVLINEDASTDGSSDILHEYQKKEPNLFNVIYQQENQYSKNARIYSDILYPKVKGRYIAFCEGDDYWTDENKLQKQVDALRNNQNCKICIHKVDCCNESGEMIQKAYPQFHLDTGIIPSKQFLKMFAKSHCVHFCSYLCDAEMLNDIFPKGKPDEEKIQPPFGDASCCMTFACLGDIYFINESMSCHRMGSEEGWTVRFNRSSAESKIDRKMKNINSVKELDALFDYKYHEEFEEWCFSKYCQIAEYSGNYRILLNKENRKILMKTSSFRYIVRIVLSSMFPDIAPKLFRKYFLRRGVDTRKISVS